MNIEATSTTLLQGLRKLGVVPGDVLFVHSSFKSLGPVEGGAEAVISALENAVGPEGLLLMPSFNLVDRDKRAECWNIRETPSTVGWITEVFRRMPSTHRSDHYSHSVAARGKDAKAFVADHLSQEGYGSPWDLAPWGKTFGECSPMVQAYKRSGKLLMLGVDYFTSTYIHFVEVIYWHRLLAQNPAAAFPRLDRLILGEFWDRTGQLQRGYINEAPCRLFGIQPYVDGLVQEVECNPEPYMIRNRN
ncbi:MAG: AAC(3) family N-acetyltransferase [Chloroflexota bacterium]